MIIFKIQIKVKDKNVKECAGNFNNEFNNLTLNKIGFSYTSKNKELNDIFIGKLRKESLLALWGSLDLEKLRWLILFWVC